jgi:hypothetical protein
MPPYSYVTFAQAKADLAGRLADPGMIFWTDAELGFYIAAALRQWNALTEQWLQDFAFTTRQGTTWYDISALPSSPRLRTITDSYLYSLMEYMLLEPPNGSGLWLGTSQFALSDLQGALQRRRDQMIQVTGCNVHQLPNIPSVPNTRRTAFPDSTLEAHRVRFLYKGGPSTGPGFNQGDYNTGQFPVLDPFNAVTLTREDPEAWDAFNPDYLQKKDVPIAWSVVAGPPLALNVDYASNVIGHYDALAIMAGPIFNPPAATNLGVPDDWSYVAVWGALGDLFSRESEATDNLRADYCIKRFNTLLGIMKASNWLLTATINGRVVDTPSVNELDGYSPEWELDSNAWPSVVTVGTDLCAPCPVNVFAGCSLVLVGNQPVPVLPGDFLQVSRDAYDVILDEAQFLAVFKSGGNEFVQAQQQLDTNFFKFAAETNKRIAKLGLFDDLLKTAGNRQDLSQPR